MPTVYRDSDPSAPTLTGQAGSLISLLDACLINGYGSKAAAGWSKPYTGGTPAAQAVYLQGGSAPNRYFQVDDNGPHVTALQREARVAPFETMTAYNTGTGNMTGGSANYTAGPPAYTCIRKSATADGTVRQWVLIADQKTFYFWTSTGDTSAFFGHWFGDIYSFRAGDQYKCGGAGRPENSAVANNLDAIYDMTFGSTSQVASCQLFRSFTGVAGAVQPTCFGDAALAFSATTTGPTGYCGMNYPHSPDGGFYLCPFYLSQGALGVIVRGKHRGLWCGAHAPSFFTDGNVIAGTGAYAGRTFMIVAPGTVQSVNGYSVVEITAGQWPSSS